MEAKNYFSKYKSKTFLNFKNLEINDSFFAKESLVIIMHNILFIWMLSFIIVGFANIANWDLLWRQTIRAVSLFLIGWFVFFQMWLIKLSFSYDKNILKEKQNKLFYLTPLPLINFSFFIWNAKNITIKKIFIYVSSFFHNEIKINYKSKDFILNLIVLIIMVPMCVMTWMPQYGSKSDSLNNIWFYGLQFFTIQTNFFCFLYCFFYVFCANAKMFKNNNYQIYATSYLIIVSVTFNAALLPVQITSGAANDWSTYKWVKTSWEHIINPIAFIATQIYLMSYRTRTQDWLTNLKFGMIIPSIYLFYALVLPFVSKESVYGVVTNCNPNLPNGEGNFLAHGEWYVCFFIIGYWFLFVGVITGFWTLNNFFYTRAIKKQETKNLIIN